MTHASSEPSRPSPEGTTPDPSATTNGLDAALGRARMLFSMLSSPKLRTALGATLREGEGCTDQPAGTDGPLARIDWLGSDGTVDSAKLRAVVDALTLMRSSDAILEVPRLEGLPPKEEDRIVASGRIARMVFDRLGRDGALSEAELNAAIAMIAPDPALVRRDAVDSGVLQRTPDGGRYRLA